MESSKTEQIIYKGIEVPAKTIKIGKNLTKLIPISTNRYILYGIPIPRDLDITEEIQTIAKRIINDSKKTTRNDKSLVIQYIRKPYRYYSRKGEPRGVIVAFLHNKKLKVGWSKRIEGDMISYGKIIQKEPLVFTKKDAVYIAVLRGLEDSILLLKSGTYMNKNKIIPKTIAEALPLFLTRVQNIFGQDPTNVSFKKGEK